MHRVNGARGPLTYYSALSHSRRRTADDAGQKDGHGLAVLTTARIDRDEGVSRHLGEACCPGTGDRIDRCAGRPVRLVNAWHGFPKGRNSCYLCDRLGRLSAGSGDKGRAARDVGLKPVGFEGMTAATKIECDGFERASECEGLGRRRLAAGYGRPPKWNSRSRQCACSSSIRAFVKSG